MQRAILLGILWATSIVGLVSASAVISCVDSNRCTQVRAVVQQSRDVGSVAQQYPRAEVVDLHANLLDKYDQPPSVQWEVLNLSYNLLTDDMFWNMRYSNLKKVDLTYNRLRTVSVPSSVIEFTAERNQLHDITVPPRNSLRKLILPKNKFDSLKKFNNIPNLQELDLSCNDLSEVNVDLLPASLRSLKLARNHIFFITGLNSLQSLEYLDMSHNILTTFSDSIDFFPNVKQLYLQNNKIVMWINEPKTSNKLHEVNLLDNDWDCKKLESLLTIIKTKAIRGPQTGDDNCKAKNNFICCTHSDAPYADRLIKYRKKEFHALQEGTAQRLTGNYSCSSNFEPNPCDGDDNLVYQMAGSAVKDAKSLAESSLQELEQTLRQEQNLVEKLQADVTKFNKENNELGKVNEDLVAYIGLQYSIALPEEERTYNGAPDKAVEKLQDLFGYFERENEKLKRQINEEERKNQDKLSEVETLEKEMEDLNYQKDRLAEDVAKRNATVNDYKAKIEKLQARLG